MVCTLVRRSYSYTVRGSAVGSLTNRVTVPQSDTNTTNNNATASVAVLGTCANSFGNGTGLACSGGASVNSSAAGLTITGPLQFDTVCCVSASISQYNAHDKSNHHLPESIAVLL
jgi:hypothetical protein